MAIVPPTILRYPLQKLESTDDYLKIDIIKYVAPGLETQGAGVALRTSDQSLLGSLKSSDTTIILPIPEGINDAVSASWGESQLSPLAGNVAASAVNIMKSGGSVFQELGNQISKMSAKISDVAKTGAGQQGVAAAMASLVTNTITGGNVTPSQLVARATGNIINQNNELLFDSVVLRSFNFSFDLTPRSKEEGERIKQIIRAFKKSMSPKKGNIQEAGGGAFIRSPDVFKLTYMSGAQPHPFLNKFKPMALDNITVNYTASGTYSTYSDATPVHMQMALSFKELTPIYEEDYNVGEATLGVGY